MTHRHRWFSQLETSIYSGFSMAVLNNRRVPEKLKTSISVCCFVYVYGEHGRFPGPLTPFSRPAAPQKRDGEWIQSGTPRLRRSIVFRGASGRIWGSLPFRSKNRRCWYAHITNTGDCCLPQGDHRMPIYVLTKTNPKQQQRINKHWASLGYIGYVLLSLEWPYHLFASCFKPLLFG